MNLEYLLQHWAEKGIYLSVAAEWDQPKLQLWWKCTVTWYDDNSWETETFYKFRYSAVITELEALCQTIYQHIYHAKPLTL